MSAPSASPDPAESLRRALRAIKELRARVEAAEGAARAPLAVVGLALRAPGGADTPEKLWALLRAGVDAVRPVPPDRWENDAYYDPDPEAAGKISVREGGFLDQVDQFDAAFFGVSPREAAHLDPQHRLLLETTWEALEHAGLSPDALAGTRGGVFVGISNQDYTQRLVARGLESIDPYVGSGNAHSVAAGRLAYTLGWHGPAVAVDTACSSSLVALHLAAQSLRAGECDFAVAGGVNLLLSPLVSVNHSRARMLSPDGRCKAFSAQADGFGRGEGCGVVLLKRLADAERAGDRILAVIRGTAINQDGRTSGLTVPSGPSQQAVIRAALQQAGVSPADIDYVEAHGTGTSLGDPIELGALGAVFAPDRPADRPLRVGSIKTNVGHLEAAAGVAGLIKVVLSLQQSEIPPHLHFHTPTPLVDWARLPLEVPVRPTPWPAGERPRLAGVSSFGFGGTNVHLVVGEPPAPPPASPPRDLEILLLSARSEPALAATAERYAAHLAATGDSWSDICHTAAIGRAAFRHRLALPASSAKAAGEALAAWGRGERSPEVVHGHRDEPPKVAFLFSGQGSLYAGVGRELAAAYPVYRAAVEECRAFIQARAGWDVGAALASEETLARTTYAQVALFVVEYGLARLWQSWGVTPALVVGHSVGEYAAACVAGALPLETALALLEVRARQMGRLPEDGAMLAVTASEAEVGPLLEPFGLELGAVNSPRQVVLTGLHTAVEAAAAEAHRRGLRAQPLAVTQAYHSRHLDPMLPLFRAAAETVLPSEGQDGIGEASFVSSVSGRPVTLATLASADYWVEQVRRPVRFAAALETLRAEGVDVAIEVGPRGILAALGQQTSPDAAIAWLTSLRPGRSEVDSLRVSASRAWVQGAPVSWRTVEAGWSGRRVALPTYPFQRRRAWYEEPAPTPASAPAWHVTWREQARIGTAPPPAGRWSLVGAPPELAAELSRRGATLVQAPGEATEGVIFWAQPGEDDLARLLATVRALRAPARLWIVTQGAVATSSLEAARVQPEAALLAAAGRVVGLEYPECGAGRIDVTPAVTAAALVDEFLGATDEREVAIREEGARWVARLQPASLPSDTFRARPEATYVITGGLGALGLSVAEWLVARGARCLLLLGRRPPTPAAEAALARLRAAAARVEVRSVDVTDATGMAAVWAEFGTSLPPLRGVVHAAGAPGYQLLPELTEAACAAVLRPKLVGARVLDALTAEQSLDFLVLFSSIAATWGSKGQAHYAAANAFLDGLAQRRRAEGRPMLSVAWGPWAGGGMAGPEAEARLAAAGVRLLTPAAALSALGRALSSDRAQVTVADVDWPRFRAVYTSRASAPWLTEWLGEPPGEPEPVAVPVARQRCLALPEAERLPWVRAQAQAAVAAILQWPAGESPDPRQGFADLGLDSLMAVELKNRLAAAWGQPLPSTLVFDYPDIERLSRYLLAGLVTVSGEASAPAPAPPPPVAPTPAQDLAAMSEEEAEALLLKKLAQL